jgi:hypothetical protein
MNYGILTTRFNNETYYEYKRWKQNNNYTGCIYNLKKRISDYNLYDRPYFVIEMNNDINKIMGIGLIQNKISLRKANIYSNPYFNRYCYEGKKHILIYDDLEGKSCLSQEDSDNLFLLFEKIIFYGKGHMKRGISMTHFPLSKMKKKHIHFLVKLMDLYAS